MADEYQVQNIHRYTRKTYKNARNSQDHNIHCPRDNTNIEITEASPRSDVYAFDSPGCSCDNDPEADLANILHKKCPVINLAQQQLLRLLQETDRLLCENPRCCRSLYDCLCYCKEILMKHNKYLLLAYITMTFWTGLVMGAATCGSHLGRFNSPILTCIDNLFIPDHRITVQGSYYSVV